MSVSLQARGSIAITSNSTGLVEIWDLLTGSCKTSFQSPATKHFLGDAKLIDGSLIFAWSTGGSTCVWESGNSKLPECLEAHKALNLMVSGDGSRVFSQGWGIKTIKIWSVRTRKLLRTVKLRGEVKYLDPLHADGSTLWIRSQDLSTQQWEFGNIHSEERERPDLDFIHGTEWGTGPCFIEDTGTGREVFRLAGRYAKPLRVKWDGQYLVAHYEDGESVILDFGYVCS